VKTPMMVWLLDEKTAKGGRLYLSIVRHLHVKEERRSEKGGHNIPTVANMVNLG